MVTASRMRAGPSRGEDQRRPAAHPNPRTTSNLHLFPLPAPLGDKPSPSGDSRAELEADSTSAPATMRSRCDSVHRGFPAAQRRRLSARSLIYMIGATVYRSARSSRASAGRRAPNSRAKMEPLPTTEDWRTEAVRLLTPCVQIRSKEPEQEGSGTLLAASRASTGKAPRAQEGRSPLVLKPETTRWRWESDPETVEALARRPRPRVREPLGFELPSWRLPARRFLRSGAQKLLSGLEPQEMT